jgi:uncharacterized protein YndB with AHSA1/START domain
LTKPISLSFEVDCSPDHAFDIWARRTSLWWPADHTATGIEKDWGEVVAWEPPRRLVYLWHLRTERSDATEVEVAFDETESGSTRIRIDHRGWERLGERGPDWRARNVRGWETLVPHFGAAVNPISLDRGGTDGTR